MKIHRGVNTISGNDIAPVDRLFDGGNAAQESDKNKNICGRSGLAGSVSFDDRADKCVDMRGLTGQDHPQPLSENSTTQQIELKQTQQARDEREIQIRIDYCGTAATEISVDWQQEKEFADSPEGENSCYIETTNACAPLNIDTDPGDILSEEENKLVSVLDESGDDATKLANLSESSSVVQTPSEDDSIPVRQDDKTGPEEGRDAQIEEGSEYHKNEEELYQMTTFASNSNIVDSEDATGDSESDNVGDGNSSCPEYSFSFCDLSEASSGDCCSGEEHSSSTLSLEAIEFESECTGRSGHISAEEAEVEGRQFYLPETIETQDVQKRVRGDDHQMKSCKVDSNDLSSFAWQEPRSPERRRYPNKGKTQEDSGDHLMTKEEAVQKEVAYNSVEVQCDLTLVSDFKPRHSPSGDHKIQSLQKQAERLQLYEKQVRSLEHDLRMERQLHQITKASLMSLTSDHNNFRLQMSRLHSPSKSNASARLNEIFRRTELEPEITEPNSS